MELPKPKKIREEIGEKEMNITDWMNELVETQDGMYSSKRSIPRIERIAELIHWNGGTSLVSGWGRITQENGIRQGLEPNEALELIYYDGLIAGIGLVDLESQNIIASKILELIDSRMDMLRGRI
jgi:hypothetical protein